MMRPTWALKHTSKQLPKKMRQTKPPLMDVKNGKNVRLLHKGNIDSLYNYVVAFVSSPTTSLRFINELRRSILLLFASWHFRSWFKVNETKKLVQVTSILIRTERASSHVAPCQLTLLFWMRTGVIRENAFLMGTMAKCTTKDLSFQRRKTRHHPWDTFLNVLFCLTLKLHLIMQLKFLS